MNKHFADSVTMKRKPHIANGFTLIEIMIALAIGSVMVLGLVEVFAASRTAYQLSEGIARVQENSRFAMDYLQRDIRMVGHLGCVNDQARFLPENDSGTRSALASTFLSTADLNANNYGPAYVPDFLRFDSQINGYEANASAPGNTVALTATPTLDTAASGWTPTLPATLDTALINRVAGSDILVLRYFMPTGAQVASFTPGAPDGSSNAQIVVNAGQWSRLTDGVTNPGLFGIADCMNAAVFNATTLNKSTGTITVKGGASPTAVNRSAMAGYQSFVPGQAMVYRAESVAYYVGKNVTSGQPSLYRVRFNLAPGAASSTAITTPEELVEGIESLQLRYGQDSRTLATQRPTGNVGSMTTANGVVPAADLDTAWRRVGMVQVGLVSRSPDSAAVAQRNTANAAVNKLSALQVVFTPPNDQRYRAVYEESVALRNRLFGN